MKRSVQNALTMLDWNDREIEFYPEEKKESDRVVDVDDKLIEEALSVEDEEFSDEEIAVRDTFDEFFGNLERFDHYIISGLVRYSEFHPYLAYWLWILTDRSGSKKPTTVVDAFTDFIDYYEYDGVQHLLNEYRRYEKTTPRGK